MLKPKHTRASRSVRTAADSPTPADTPLMGCGAERHTPHKDNSRPVPATREALRIAWALACVLVALVLVFQSSALGLAPTAALAAVTEEGTSSETAASTRTEEASGTPDGADTAETGASTSSSATDSSATGATHAETGTAASAVSDASKGTAESGGASDVEGDNAADAATQEAASAPAATDSAPSDASATSQLAAGTIGTAEATVTTAAELQAAIDQVNKLADGSTYTIKLEGQPAADGSGNNLDLGDSTYALTGNRSVTIVDAGTKVSITRSTTDQKTPLVTVNEGVTLTVSTSTAADDLLSYSNQKAPFLRVLQGGTATIAHGTFSNNEADYGPVLQNGYEYYTPTMSWTSGGKPDNYEKNWTVEWHHGGTATISGGIYQGNKATASYFGGGVVYSYAATGSSGVTISGGLFRGNSSSANGVYRAGEKNYDPHLHLFGASGTHGGGVLYSRQGYVTVTGGQFLGNTADGMNYDGSPRNNYGGGGGVLYVANESQGNEKSTLTISGGTFGGANTGDGNVSTGSGGAIFVAWHVDAEILSASFVNNSCVGMGGAIYSEDTSTVEYGASAAWDNHAGHFGGGLWLCPSGMGITSKTGNIALFGNTANPSYDQRNDTKDFNGAAGDDFALMYPVKDEVPSNSYLLSNNWFNGVPSVTWYEDGQPNYRATGFGDFVYSAFGPISLQDSFWTNNVPRYADASNPTLYNEQNIVLTRHIPANDAVDHGVSLKAVVNPGVDVDFVKQNAKVIFTGNVAQMSGGAIGTNGNVVFGKNSIAEWEKVDTNDGSALAGSSWTITGKSGYSEKAADDYAWKDATDAQKANRWTELDDGSWKAVVEDNTGQADYHGYDSDPEPGKFLVENLATNSSYEIRETSAPAGYAPSDKAYTFVTGSGQSAGAPQLHVVAGGNVANNAIGNTPLPSIPAIELKEHKTLAGGTLAEGQFSFDLSERTGDAAPYTYKSVETGVPNAADGSVAFQPITYTAPGEHVYRVSEQIPADATKNPDGTFSKDGITYDATTYYVKVTVSWGWKDAAGNPVQEGTAGAVKNLVASASYFSDEACTQAIDGAAYPNYVPEFTNQATTGWQFTKVDGSGGTAAPLAGAQFKLFRLADGATDAGDVLDPDNPGASWVLAGEATSSDGSGGVAAGLVSFSNLTSGTYRLVETKASSSDYATPSGQWVVTVDTTAAGDAAHPKVSVTKTVGATPPAFKDNGDGTQSLPNYKGMTLPISGSSGTWLSAGIGAALIVSALITAIVRRKEFR